MFPSIKHVGTAHLSFEKLMSCCHWLEGLLFRAFRAPNSQGRNERQQSSLRSCRLSLNPVATVAVKKVKLENRPIFHTCQLSPHRFIHPGNEKYVSCISIDLCALILWGRRLVCNTHWAEALQLLKVLFVRVWSESGLTNGYEEGAYALCVAMCFYL